MTYVLIIMFINEFFLKKKAPSREILPSANANKEGADRSVRIQRIFRICFDLFDFRHLASESSRRNKLRI